MRPEDIRRLQEKVNKLTGSPGFRALQEQQRRLQRILDDPSVQQAQRAAALAASIDPALLRRLQLVQEQFTRILDNPEFQALLDRELPPPLIGEVESYERELENRVLQDGEEVATSGAWLIGEAEGLLRALQLIVNSVAASEMPDQTVALVSMLVQALLLILWALEGRQNEDDK